MRLTMSERRAVTAVMVARYRRASKKEQKETGRLLDELIASPAATAGMRWGCCAATGARRRRRQVARGPRQRRRLYDATCWRRCGAFALRGIDSDNGSEFINDHLLRYAQKEKLTFTRGRAWRKNDGCFDEQKN